MGYGINMAKGLLVTLKNLTTVSGRRIRLV